MPSRQEARPHAVSFRAKPQVEACRLKLTLVELRSPQRVPVDQLPDLLPREQTARPGELRRARQRGAGIVRRTNGHESRGRKHVHAVNYRSAGTRTKSASSVFPVIPERVPGEADPGERAYQRQRGEGM